MRHNKHHASLGVTREHRESMLSNLAAALITHGRIQTTLTKARVLRPFIEKMITKAKHAAAKTEKKDAVHLRRLALRDVRDEGAMTLLFNEKYKEFANRAGGYTRIYKLGTPAPGRRGRDGADRIREGGRPGLQEVQGQEGRGQGRKPKRRACPRGRARGDARAARGRGEEPVRLRASPDINTRRSLPSTRFLFLWGAMFEFPAAAVVYCVLVAIVFLALALLRPAGPHALRPGAPQDHLPLHPLRPALHRPEGTEFASARAAVTRTPGSGSEAVAPAVGDSSVSPFPSEHAANHRRPRFRFAIHPGDRPADPRVPGLLEDLPLLDAGRDAAQGRCDRDHPVRRAEFGLLANAPMPDRGSSGWGCRSLGSATAFSSWATCSAGRSPGASAASTATAPSDPEPRAALSGLPRKLRVWNSHGDKLMRLPPGFAAIGRTENSPYAVIEDPQAQLLRDPVPPRGVPHRAGDEVLRNFLVGGLPRQAGLDHQGFYRARGEGDPATVGTSG